MTEGSRTAGTLSPLLVPLLFGGVFAAASPAAVAGVVQTRTQVQVQVQASALPAPGMLPDHALYAIKSALESVGTLLTFGDVEEGERSLDLAEKRLSEARALAAGGNPAPVERTIVRYQDQLDRALASLEAARARGVDVDVLAGRASVATLRYQAVLAEVYERVPDAARSGIERAMEASMNGHEEAIGAISGRKRAEVMRDVERARREAGPRLEELRARGIPVPAVRIRGDVERGRPKRPAG